MYSSTVYIRTVSSKRLLSAWENWFMSHLDRSTCTVDLISAQTSQEGIKYDFEVKSNQDLIVLI